MYLYKSIPNNNWKRNDRISPLSHTSGRRQWHPTPVLLPGKSHGQRSLVGCSPWGREESDMTERLHFHFSLSCIEKEMATHSSILAWRIPGTGEPGRLPSMGSHRVGPDWSDLAIAVSTQLFFSICCHAIEVICQFSFQSQRKAMPKNAQTTTQLDSSHTLVK